MKVKYAVIIIVALLACNNTGKRYHDGTYVCTDTSERNPFVQQIAIDGKWMYHTIHATKENSSSKRYKMLCIQYPDKITLPLMDGHSVLVEINSKGDLIYEDHVFKKEPPTIIIPVPLPKAFQENQER